MDLLKFVVFDDDAVSIEFPQTVKNPRQNINVLSRLGLDPPSAR